MASSIPGCCPDCGAAIHTGPCKFRPPRDDEHEDVAEFIRRHLNSPLQLEPWQVRFVEQLRGFDPLDGERVSHVTIDELGSDLPRRTLIIQRPDQSTWTADVPEDLDLGQVLGRGDVLVYDSSQAS